MSHAPENDGYDPFRIDSITEVDQILVDLIKQGVLVHMHGGNPSHSVITTLVNINFDKDLLVIDSAAQKSINHQIVENEKAYFSAQINQVNIEFQVEPITETTYEDHPALMGPIPHFLRRIQRRDSFRVQPGTTKPANCTLTHRGEAFTLPVFDISAGGVSVLDDEHVLDSYEIHKGHIFPNSTLDLPGVGHLTIDLQLVRQQTQGSTAGKKISRYGCAFFSFSASDKIRVQNYIDQEERLRIARDRGLA